MAIDVSSDVEVITIAVPGVQGPPGVFRVGTVATGAPGTNAIITATTDVNGAQVVDFTIPRGDSAPDATATVKGSSKLAGDLGGTADLPTVISGINHTHTSTQISDSTATGRSVITAADAVAARAAIGAGTSSLTLGTTNTTAAAGNHTHTATVISDSTTTGRAVLTAADAAAARTAIGAGTSSLALGVTSTTAAAGDHTHAALTADQAAGTASVRTLGTGALQAAAGNHTHSALTADQAAGTASVRTLGTGAQQAAAGNHTHAALTADQIATTASVRTLGAGAQQAAAGDHTHADLTNATNAATPNTLVKRDVSGNASFGGVTASTLETTGGLILPSGQSSVVPASGKAQFYVSQSGAGRVGYVLGDDPGIVRSLPTYFGAGTIYPAAGSSTVLGATTGDTFYHNGLSCLMVKSTAGEWRQAHQARYASKSSRDTASGTYSADLHVGFQCRLTDSGTVWEWNGSAWVYVGGGTGTVNVDVAADATPGANWNLVSAFARYRGQFASIEMTASIKTTAINVPADGNIANQNGMVVMAQKWFPLNTTICAVGGVGPLTGAYYQAVGNFQLVAYAPGGTLSVGTQVNLVTGWFPLADPNLIY